MQITLPQDVLETVASLCRALDSYNRTLFQRLVLIEGVTDSRCDLAQYRRGYEHMKQQFPSHVQESATILDLGESLHCWLERYKYRDDAPFLGGRLSRFRKHNELADEVHRSDEGAYCVVFGTLRWEIQLLHRELLELRTILKKRNNDWQNIPPGERDLSAPLTIDIIAAALDIKPKRIGTGRRRRYDWRPVHDRLKGKMIRIKGTHRYRMRLDLLDPADAQAIRDAARHA